MAVAYKNAFLGTLTAATPTTVYTATGGSAIIYTISIANKHTATVNVNLTVIDSSNANASYFIGSNVPVAVGGNLVYEQQVTLENGDSLAVTCDIANGVDAVLSIAQFS